ncbi:unnamed protein product [Ixodes hexagonus]
MAAVAPVAGRYLIRSSQPGTANGISGMILVSGDSKFKAGKYKRCKKCRKKKRTLEKRQSSNSSASSDSDSKPHVDKHDKSNFKSDSTALVDTKIQICAGDNASKAMSVKSWQSSPNPRSSSRKAFPQGSAGVGLVNKSKQSQTVRHTGRGQSFITIPLPQVQHVGKPVMGERARPASEIPISGSRNEAAVERHDGELVLHGANGKPAVFKSSAAIFSRGLSPTGPQGVPLLSPNENLSLSPNGGKHEEITPSTFLTSWMDRGITGCDKFLFILMLVSVITVIVLIYLLSTKSGDYSEGQRGIGNFEGQDYGAFDLPIPKRWTKREHPRHLAD